MKNADGSLDYISIHVPREGHDPGLYLEMPLVKEFQSTCPARGTTQALAVDRAVTLFQSTCPARGTTSDS